MANYTVAYGSKDRINHCISTGVIPPGSLILTDDSSEVFFYDLDKNLKTYEERYKFHSLEEAEKWVDKYDCKGQILSVHDGDKCNIYIVEYNNKLVPITSGSSVKETRNPTEEDYSYDILTHWINTVTDDVFILVNIKGIKAVWKPLVTGDKIQPDWSITDENDPRFIKNKPIISGSGISYTHNQVDPSDNWVVNHNLGKFPSIIIVDDQDNVVMGDISYTNVNSLIVRFNGKFSGKAYLN